MLESQIEFRVRYAETDAQGVVHHSNYLVWFELGRSELLRQAGIPYAEVEKQGVLFVVAKASLTYKKPAVYDDLIRLTTRVVRGRSRLVEFAYEVHNSRQDLLVTGSTTHMVVDRQHRPATMPEAVAALLK